jgi:hypothetical protein
MRHERKGSDGVETVDTSSAAADSQRKEREKGGTQRMANQN